MRNSILAVTVAMLAGSAAAADADFTLVNKTGYSIREVYISPAKRNRWGSDRLGDGVLDNEKSRFFRFRDAATCRNDMKVVFEEDKTEVVWQNVDLCEVDKLTLRYNRRTGEVAAVKG